MEPKSTSSARFDALRLTVLLALMTVTVTPLHAGGTLAGTSIDNVATATFDGPAGTQTVTSNTVKLRVDELLGVVVASAETGSVAAVNGDTAKPVRFQVTNAGNGPEAFSLASLSTIGGDDFDPALVSIVLDSNGNGAFDAGTDTLYAAGGNDPVLQPDQSVGVFVLATMPAAAADGARGTVRLTAIAATGSGAPGTVFAGLGEAGGDALVGSTTAKTSADNFYALASLAVTFTKSATVLDPFGGARAVPGAIISYRLAATLAGTGALANLKLSDTIPAGTTYQPGTLGLNGSALTDAADTDTGLFAAGALSVTLPTAAAGSTQTVSFNVKID